MARAADSISAKSLEPEYAVEAKSIDEEAQNHDQTSTPTINSEDTKHHDGSGAGEVTESKSKPEGEVTTTSSSSSSTARDEAFLVGYDGPDDPYNPKNWTGVWRWYLVCLATTLAILSSIASSSVSGIFEDLEKEFGFSSEVATLLISVFLVGFTLGPLLWAPLSEVYGRRPIFVVAIIGFTIFQVACALARTTAQMIIFRFISGAIAISPLALAPSLIGDVCHPHERALGVGIFTLSPLVGPVLGPIASGFLHNAGVSWRWMFWILSISGGVMIVVTLLTLRETYPPTLLVHKAQKKRKETGDDRWYAPLETVKVPIGEKMSTILVKPWKIFFREPMLICIHVYIAFQYGLLYLNFESYPVVFGKEKGYSPGIAALTFLGIFVGGVLAIIFIMVYYAPRYAKVVKEHAPNPAPPEARLPPAQLGSFMFMISLFIFGWFLYSFFS